MPLWLPSPSHARQAISNLRNFLDGPPNDDQGIVGPSGGPDLVPTDANGLAFARTTQQVPCDHFDGCIAGFTARKAE